MDQYQDADDKQSRIGYIGRVTYSFANRYFLEAQQDVMHPTCLLRVNVWVIFLVFLQDGELLKNLSWKIS